MSRTVFFLFVIVAVLSIVLSAPDKCGNNEEWTTCGTLCPPKCGPRKPILCADICVVGCQCKPGYLRNSHNKCVLPYDCDS